MMEKEAVPIALTSEIIKVNTTGFKYKMGTSGCREKYKDFKLDFCGILIQAIADYLINHVNDKELQGKDSLIIGGDPRLDNPKRIILAAEILAANGFKVKVVKHDGLASTPAMSYLIRKENALGGLIFTASHNPGGEDGDAGLKFNLWHGGAAPLEVTNEIVSIANNLTDYKRLPYAFLEKEGFLSEINAVKSYADMMENIFNLKAIKQSGLKFVFDAMHGTMGPFIEEIFKNKIKMDVLIINKELMPDFGGRYPEPVEENLPELMDFMRSGEYDMGAAYDSDGDRNKHIGKGGFIITASDLVAIIADNMDDVKGLGRSMPTSRALDMVAKEKDIELYETPTGWKYFVDLFEKKKINLAGEESDGISSDHIREKDGLWATLALLQIMAETGKSLKKLNEKLWKKYGRYYYKRINYKNISIDDMNKMIEKINKIIQNPPDFISSEKLIKAYAYEYKYNEEIVKDGWVIETENGRMIFRFSGTDTTATLRQYAEIKSKDFTLDEEIVLGDFIKTGKELVF